MRRREFIAGVGSAAVSPLAARGQQGDRVRRIGVLMSTAKGDPGGLAEMAGFYRGLADRGWIEGRNTNIEVRWASALDIEDAEAAAKELVALKPDVLLARARQATAALKRETGTIPIVFVNVIAPVELGLVQSLAQPGGNVTGFTNFEVSVGGKMLQLLKEVDPRIVRAAVIYSPQNGSARFHLSTLESAASALGVEITTKLVRSDADIEAAMMALARPRRGKARRPSRAKSRLTRCKNDRRNFAPRPDATH
jgi:putative tryptophan/tyrosine transport system substrate-binding protein